MASSPGRLIEGPYHRVLRLQEEAHAEEVRAHAALLAARRLEARAARLEVKARKMREKATARSARSQSVGERAYAMVHEEEAIEEMLKVEKSRQLTFDAEALDARANAVESQAEQLRISARGKITESSRFLTQAKRLHLEAEGAKALI